MGNQSTIDALIGDDAFARERLGCWLPAGQSPGDRNEKYQSNRDREAHGHGPENPKQHDDRFSFEEDGPSDQYHPKS